VSNKAEFDKWKARLALMEPKGLDQSSRPVQPLRDEGELYVVEYSTERLAGPPRRFSKPLAGKPWGWVDYLAPMLICLLLARWLIIAWNMGGVGQ